MPTLTNYEQGWITLTTAMIEAADDHELCSAYDDFVESVNNRLPLGLKVPTRMKQYEVSFVVTLSNDAAENLEGAIDSWCEDECGTDTSNYEMNQR